MLSCPRFASLLGQVVRGAFLKLHCLPDAVQVCAATHFLCIPVTSYVASCVPDFAKRAVAIAAEAAGAAHLDPKVLERVCFVCLQTEVVTRLYCSRPRYRAPGGLSVAAAAADNVTVEIAFPAVFVVVVASQVGRGRHWRAWRKRWSRRHLEIIKQQRAMTSSKYFFCFGTQYRRQQA